MPLRWLDDLQADEPEIFATCGSCGTELGFDVDDMCPACGEPI